MIKSIIFSYHPSTDSRCKGTLRFVGDIENGKHQHDKLIFQLSYDKALIDELVFIEVGSEKDNEVRLLISNQYGDYCKSVNKIELEGIIHYIVLNEKDVGEWYEEIMVGSEKLY